MNRRAELRAHAVSLLAAANVCDGRVFRSRLAAYRERDIPAVGVYTLSESADDQDSFGGRYVLTLRLAVEIVAALTDDVDDVIDAVAGRIEDALLARPGFTGDERTILLTGTSVEYQLEHDRKPDGFVSCRLDFDIAYDAEPPQPVAPDELDDFNLAHVDMDVDADGDVDLSIDINPRSED